MDNYKVYNVLYGVNDHDIIGSRGWLPYEQVYYESYDEAYSKMLEFKKQFLDKTWAVEEVIGLGSGVIKCKI